MSDHDTEQTPLLQNGSHSSVKSTKVEFDKNGDESNPREWPLRDKALQVAQIFFLALICPMASSMFAPAIEEIAETFDCSKQLVLLGQTLFMVGLGTAPLFLAPMSETFGRRPLFVTCLAIFTLVQIPTALSQNAAMFGVFRFLSGLVGSVGVANGGGSIFDMFETHERAIVLGIYLTGPLLGPTLGPLIGGLIVGSMHWRWIFWVLLMISAVITTVIYFFLPESNATVILQQRKNRLQSQNPDKEYVVEGVSDLTLFQKVKQNSTRAVRILLTQPIVAILSLYQAIIFSSLYSLYAQYETIWSSPPYNFTQTQVGLAYLGPGTGFVIMAIISIIFIDKIYNYLSRRNNNDGFPEYRLPLANVGALFLPISLFWFGWTIDYGLQWPIPMVATAFFGASHVSVFNPVQTYYIEAYGTMAASALAAGAFLRSIVGGVVPLVVSKM